MTALAQWVDEMRARYGAAMPAPTSTWSALPTQKPPVIMQSANLGRAANAGRQLAE